LSTQFCAHFIHRKGAAYPKPARRDPGFLAWYLFFDLLTLDALKVTEETYDFLTEIMNRTVDE